MARNAANARRKDFQAKNRLRTTGRGYMQAGFPKIIRKTLSVKTNSLMKRTRKTLSCLHIAAVVYRAVFPPCLSFVYSFLEFRCFSVFLRFFSVSAFRFMIRSFPFHCKVDFFILFYWFLFCLLFNCNLILILF